MNEPRPTRIEVYLIDKDQQLKLGTPASVEFTNISQTAGERVIINGNITLDPIRSIIDGSGTFPAELKPSVQQNELDLTPYIVRFTNKSPTNRLQVVCKYYTN